MSIPDDAQPVEPSEEASAGSADDAAAAPEAPVAESDSAPATVEDLQAALADRNDRYTRLAADFENFRRRSAQERLDRARYASEDAARAVLPVLDNLRRALDHAGEESAAAFAEGVRMVARQFEEALASLGVQPIDSVGARFDPSVHEAVAGEESPEVTEDTVIGELLPGYRLHDRVLRPAVVRVAHPTPGAAPRH